MLEIRFLERCEIEKLRDIDRSEVIEGVYYIKNGQLKLKKELTEGKGWEPHEYEEIIKHLNVIYDRNGIILGALKGEKLIAVSVLDSEFIGSAKDQLQLCLHHVDRKYRGEGIGGKMFRLMREKARNLGAKKLYISAAPSKNTVDFYLHMGCQPASEINPRLFKLEPKDIHLELKI